MSGGTMADRFRGQDLNREFTSEDENTVWDEHDEPPMQDEQGGQAERPETDFLPEDEEFGGDWQ